jgi:hypothetical protein
VGKAAVKDDIDGPARLARECGAVTQAVMLAHWIGTGARQVTASEVLRRADVSAAGAALRVHLPAKVRTAAYVPALHRPWCTGLATGLLQISDGEARCGPAVAHWPPADGEMLAGWLAGLRGVCAAESDPRSKESVSVLVLAFLVVLDVTAERRRARISGQRWTRRCAICVTKSYWRAWDAASSYADLGPPGSLAGLFTLLAAFGAVTGAPGTPRITALGQWAMARTRDDLPAPASPQLPAGDLLARLARFDGAAERHNVAGDHLHNFAVGDRRYSDPCFGLEEVTDEEELRVPEAFQAGAKKIVYTYDFGAGWQHEITLEKRAERQPGQPYPACIAFSGDSPVEYWDEDDPSDPEPFSLSEVNQRLAADDKPGGSLSPAALHRSSG